jgi:hypothetical protein
MSDEPNKHSWLRPWVWLIGLIVMIIVYVASEDPVERLAMRVFRRTGSKVLINVAIPIYRPLDHVWNLLFPL